MNKTLEKYFFLFSQLSWNPGYFKTTENLFSENDPSEVKFKNGILWVFNYFIEIKNKWRNTKPEHNEHGVSRAKILKTIFKNEEFFYRLGVTGRNKIEDIDPGNLKIRSFFDIF